VQKNPWFKYGAASLAGFLLLGPGGTAAGLFAAVVLSGLLGGGHLGLLSLIVKAALAAVAFIALRQAPEAETAIVTVSGLILFFGVLRMAGIGTQRQG